MQRLRERERERERVRERYGGGRRKVGADEDTSLWEGARALRANCSSLGMRVEQREKEGKGGRV
jgi:hypothetical protein